MKSREFLSEALALIVRLPGPGARLGYVELRTDPDGQDEAIFGVTHGCEEGDVADVRAHFSSGVIAEAMAAGHVILTVSAMLDPRFCANCKFKQIELRPRPVRPWKRRFLGVN